MMRPTPRAKTAMSAVPTGTKRRDHESGWPRTSMMSSIGTSVRPRLTRPVPTEDSGKAAAGRYTFFKRALPQTRERMLWVVLSWKKPKKTKPAST